MSAEDIAKQFINHFYSKFHPPQMDQLAGLYQPQSQLKFEGEAHVGAQAIIEKYRGLGSLQFAPTSFDVQPSTNNNAMLIMITGNVKIGGQENPLHYTQCFQLVATTPGAYYVHNDIFRLVYM